MKFANRILAATGAVAVAAALACASSAAAAAVSITSYVLNNVPASGFGGWYHDADTLNDGIIPTTQNDDLLLDLQQAASITFTLSGSFKITDIQILSNYTQNYIPGNLVSALFTIGANSVTLSNSGFGAANPYSGYFMNESLTVTGPLANVATNTFTLSNFVSHGAYTGYTSLGEVVVNGTPGVPEPAAWALMISGFGIAGGMLRRRRTALAA